MIETSFHFPNERFDAAIDALLLLPKSLAPTSFGSDENRGRAEGGIADNKRFRAFVNKSSSGFFLFGEQTCFSLRKAEGVEFVVDAEGVSARESLELLELLGPLGCSFAYAADSEERAHRNRLIKSANYGAHEAWVGRDWKRYIPGLYWATILPEALVELHGTPLSELKAAAEDVREIAHGLWLLRFYDQPENWRLHADRLDMLCSSLPGIFSVESVRSGFQSSLNFLETTDFLRRWR